MYLPSYTREQLLAQCSDYFKIPSRYSPAPSRTLIGQPRPDQAHSCTWFVVRIGHRGKYRMMKNEQNSTPGARGYRYHRRYWMTTGYTYAIAAHDWQSDNVTEVKGYATKAEALSHLKK
jgi:hypothetical protein